MILLHKITITSHKIGEIIAMASLFAQQHIIIITCLKMSILTTRQSHTADFAPGFQYPTATAWPGLATWLHHQAGWLFQCYTGTPAYGPLCANMTPPIKPEVHNVLQRRAEED